MHSPWTIAPGRALDLSAPRVIAILNITPDSFSDGGQLSTTEAALAAAARAVSEGAAMLDIGGESTRPGAARVGADEQIARTVTVIRAIRAAAEPLASIPISIDTTRAAVAEAALDAGAEVINDVSAGLEDPDMLPLATARGTGIILMHRLHPPDADQYSDRYRSPPVYADVVAAVREFLAGRAREAERAGVSRHSIVIDPGLGFGKTVEQNLELIRRSAELASLGYPLLSAASRKSFVGRAMGLAESSPADRLPGSIAVSIAHALAGVNLFRVHDVAAHVQALSTIRRIVTPPEHSVHPPSA
jgi:dihydropteroate synthase